MVGHHIIISGTGRAGTTFLVQLITALGFDTGFASPNEGVFENCNAGMEWDLGDRQAPYFVKNPWLCDHLDTLLGGGQVVIDHAFIPIRDLYSAAESRRSVTRETDPTVYPRDIPGGLWGTSTPETQEAVLAQKLYKLIYTIAAHDIPVSLLHFPKLVHDPKYLYAKMAPALSGCKFDRFVEAFQRVARPELINNFMPPTILPFGAAIRSVWGGLTGRTRAA